MKTGDLPTTTPMLSIITVNYNNNLGLIKTLESIKKQSFSDYEHIIIDAGSTDGSKETIMAYEKTTSHLSYWCSQPDKGIYDGMNKGIKLAKGNYLCFLNSGDCFIDNILSQIPFDGTQYLYGDSKIIKSDKKIVLKTHPEIPDLVYLSNDYLHHQSSFFHRSLFEHRQYDINYKIIADWIHTFQCIIIDRCTYRYLPFIIAECDGHGISTNRKQREEERTRWFKSYFPPVLSKGLIDCSALEGSTFRDILPLIKNTGKFKQRIKKVILFLYRINAFFSKRKK